MVGLCAPGLQDSPRCAGHPAEECRANIEGSWMGGCQLYAVGNTSWPTAMEGRGTSRAAGSTELGAACGVCGEAAVGQSLAWGVGGTWGGRRQLCADTKSCNYIVTA